MNNIKFYDSDPWLKPFTGKIDARISKCKRKEKQLTGGKPLSEFAMGHFYYGLHRTATGWVFREKAPNAQKIFITGTFSGWKENAEYQLLRINSAGDWEITLPEAALKHLDLYKIKIYWEGGSGERIPSYANRLIQDDKTKLFAAQVWEPEEKYSWKVKHFNAPSSSPLIYEAHVGMATTEERTGTYKEFSRNIIPRIADAGYNTIQLMAVQEHPFYGSFGYHVANFFAPSSRFGTPDDLKELIDTAHSYGISVIMDLIHSHSVKNINEGLGLFDGSPGLYFHADGRRYHRAWDSLCFDYGKENVMHFLLSNCRYWLEEFRFDGFRFDGITSMIYYDHGLDKNFTKYDEYFDGGQDEEALSYLYLANKLIHTVNPHAVTVAEEMSGMPGIAAPSTSLGYGFDYRLSMGVPDYWIKLIKDQPDETWDMGALMHELTQHRAEEKIISYCESHDQALVGDKTLIFRMLDSEMYTGMHKDYHSIVLDRGIALHKMIRLITFSTAGGGYLTFMGNEFGHPEWIDFPREGNNWSYRYARRQWNLVDNKDLKFRYLAAFDRKMVSLQNDYHFMDRKEISRIFENSNDKVIAYTRGDLLFVFNFHSNRSYTDYGIPVKGKFKVVLDSDDDEFGGFNRIDRSLEYTSVSKIERRTQGAPFKLNLYLPARTAIVFRAIPIRRATDS